MSFFSIVSLNLTFAQLTADAGGDNHFCTYPDSINALIIGGNPSALGGFPPYSYEWSIEPFDLFTGSNITITTSDVLNDTSIANPNIIDFTIKESFKFKLKVIDDIGQVAFDSCIVSFSSFAKTLMTYTYSIPYGDSILLTKGVNVGWLFDNDSLTFDWTSGETLSDSTLETDFWASPDTTTWYSVKVTDRYGCVAHGDPYYYVIVQSLGIDNNEKPEISIFPNPVKDILYIKYNDKILIDEIKVSDLNGKIILRKQQDYGIAFINVSGLSSGMYSLISYSNRNKIFETKIIIE
jgi:hypothetical protein